MNRNSSLIVLLVLAVAAGLWFLLGGSSATDAAGGTNPAAAAAQEAAAASPGAGAGADQAAALLRSESAPVPAAGGAETALAGGQAEILLAAVDHAQRSVPNAWAAAEESEMPEGPGGFRFSLPNLNADANAAARVFADARGQISLRVPAGRPLALQVGGDAFQTKTLELQPLRAGERLTLGPVPLLAGATLGGKVLDPTGQPVAGARVALRSADRTRGFMPGGRNADTDAAGRFRFDGVEPGAYLLEAEAHGYAPARGETGARVEAKTGAVLPEATLRLQEGRVLRGMVVDQDRRPIAGAEVYLRSPIRGGAFAFTLPGAAPGRAPDAVTDGAGRFSLQGVEQGAGARVNARAPGYGLAWATVDAQAAEVLVTLKPALRLAGKVLDPQGRPVAGTEVSLARAEDGDSGFNFLSLFDDHTATTADDGSFSMEGLDPGLWNVHAAAGSASAQGVQADLTQDLADFIVRLEPASVLALRVTRDTDGAPVADALVTLTPAQADADFGGPPGQARRDVRIRVGGPGGARVDFGGDAQRRRTDAAGGVSFADLAEGNYELRIEAAGFATHEETLARERGPQELRVALLPGADVVVRVEDGAGAPLPGVEVAATPVDPALKEVAQAKTQRTDASGRAVFAGLPPGNWSVDYRAAEAPNGIRFAGPGLGLGGDDKPKESHTAQTVGLIAGTVQEVLLRATGLCIPTVVVTRRGAPLPNASVRSEAVGAGGFPGLPGFGGERTDGAGRVRLQPLEPGSYEVVVTPGGNLPERREKVELAAGEQEIKVDVRGGRVTGIVEADGLALAAANARLEPASAGARGGGRRGRFLAITATDDGQGGGQMTSFGGPAATAATVDGGGNFVFEEVPAGEYVVCVSAPGYAPWTSEKFVLQEEQAHDVGSARLASGGVLKGVNRRAQGQQNQGGFGNGFVLLMDVNGGNAGFSPIGPDGGYEFRDLAAGSYTLTIPPDYNSDPIEVKPGQTVSFDIPK